MSDPVAQLFSGTVDSDGNSDYILLPTNQGIGMVVNITAVSGTLPSLTLTLQHSLDQTVFVNVPNGQGSFSLAGLDSPGTYALYFPTGQNLFDYARLSWTVGGTESSFTFDASMGTVNG
jgi:hypothetical protein